MSTHIGLSIDTGGSEPAYIEDTAWSFAGGVRKVIEDALELEDIVELRDTHPEKWKERIQKGMNKISKHPKAYTLDLSILAIAMFTLAEMLLFSVEHPKAKYTVSR